MRNPGTFCISLDFEKYWGIHDVTNWQQCHANLLLVKTIVNRKIKLFESNNIHASWATVGLLGMSQSEFIQNNPPFEISYENANFNPFPFSQKKFHEIPFEILDGTEELKWLLESKHQELSSHTFSHYYSLENGQIESEFDADCAAMRDLGKSLNHEFKSIVFPRNQINKEYLRVCKKHGIRSYRGNQESKSWSNSDFKSEGYTKRLKRLSDAYYKVEKTKSYTIEELEFVEGLLNIPANRFLRPISSSSWKEKKKIIRIKNEMTDAAIANKIYHLWWHPHNFTQNTELAFAQLEEILNHYKELNSKYGFESLNMSEIEERRSK